MTDADLTVPETETNPESVILYETPLLHERHPVNFLKVIGDSIKSYRNGLPPGEQSRNSLCNVVAMYIGSPVHRQRLARAEEGDPKIAMGVYAAIFNEMGLLDKIAMLCYGGSKTNLRYLHILGDELAADTARALKAAEATLQRRSHF